MTPHLHLKALSEYHACEDWEKGGKRKPCIRRHCHSWGRTWSRRWCRPLSRHHRHGWDRHHSKCQHRGAACNLACHSVCLFVLLKRNFQMISLFARRWPECSLGSVHAKTAENIPKLILCFFINNTRPSIFSQRLGHYSHEPSARKAGKDTSRKAYADRKRQSIRYIDEEKIIQVCTESESSEDGRGARRKKQWSTKYGDRKIALKTKDKNKKKKNMIKTETHTQILNSALQTREIASKESRFY